MSKQGKREELNIGVNGLKVNNLLTQKLKSPFEGVELTTEDADRQQYQIPASWPEPARKEAITFFYPDEISGDDEQPQNETIITQVIHRVVEAWRWWGDSYSYFNRKTDALNFSNELKYILINRIASPNLACWQTLGIRQAYGVRGEPAENTYFIDPDTNNIYAVRDTFTHPQILTKHNTNLICDFYIDTTHPIWQDAQLAMHIVRLITIAQDISILASGYPSQEAAEQSLSKRQISFGLIPEAKDLGDKLVIEALATSAELANVISGNLEASNEANTQLKQIDADNGLKTEVAAATNLVKKYGVRNFVHIATYSAQIPDFLKNPLTENVQETAKEAESNEISSTKQSPKSNLPKLANITQNMNLNSITQEFSIGNLSGYLILVPEMNKLLIHSGHSDLEQEGTMKIFTKILSLYLRNHLAVEELEEIVGLSSDENINQLQRFIIDWLRKSS